ncbi:hypothetical protein PRIPAC_94592 [Pristionchus pacificus]|uniref:Uncharacterized protein n=1 Tax=Pristionchus pacificus TaxID=54126 RepID=A0A2A6BAU7_PRIPA|nr:hypothetical protein PRIPAC_94592 [Pristionchus pacificus]|eukprot:PDM63000.1 hypothetical protein PRIPAC_50215 [Pristionchus pacificus]
MPLSSTPFSLPFSFSRVVVRPTPHPPSLLVRPQEMAELVDFQNGKMTTVEENSMTDAGVVVTNEIDANMLKTIRNARIIVISDTPSAHNLIILVFLYATILPPQNDGISFLFGRYFENRVNGVVTRKR